MIARAEGVTGLDARPRSLRSMLQASEAKLRADWDRTAQVLWMLAEINRDRKRRPQPFAAADFNPMIGAKERREIRKKDKPKLTREDFIRACVADLRRNKKPVPENLLKEIGEA